MHGLYYRFYLISCYFISGVYCIFIVDRLIVESDLEKEIAILSFLLLLLSRMRLPRRSWNRIFWLVLKEGEVTAAAAAV